MPKGRLQFRLLDLIAAMALLAAILASAVYLPSTYKTHGAVGSLLASAPIVLTWLVVGVCFCFRRLRLPAVVITLLVCALFSWRQASLVNRLRLLEVEVPRIVAYVEKFKTEHGGDCPDDLSGYAFERPELAPFVRYTPPRPYQPKNSSSDLPYQIHYHPRQSADVSHWYLSTGGYWYDDD